MGGGGGHGGNEGLGSGPRDSYRIYRPREWYRNLESSLPNRLIMPYIPSPPKKKTFFSLTSVITLIPNFSTTHHTSHTTQHTPHTTHHTPHITHRTPHTTHHTTHNTQHTTHNTQYFKLSRPHFL